MSVRLMRLDDVAAAAALLNRIADEDGAGWVDEDELRGWLTSPAHDTANFALLEQDGSLAGYCDLVVLDGPERRASADLRVPRDLRGGPVEAALLGWCERRAVELGTAAARVSAEDERTRALLEARGYRYIRSFYEMGVDLAGPPEAVEPPQGVEIRPLRPGEERAVYEAQQEAFADHWGFQGRSEESWRGELMHEGFDPRLWFVGDAGTGPAGICLCRLRTRSGRRVGWVEVLGVRPAWRGRGLGRALLVHAFRDFADRGLDHAGLDVDAENTTGAVGLYERAGMRPVHRSDRYELPLARAGNRRGAPPV